MKKLLIFTILAITTSFAFGQRSIDNLFNKYAGKDGFTTVTISGNLLKLLNYMDDDDADNSFPAKITEIRVLAQDDSTISVDNFYYLVMKDIDLKNYDEFMRVKKTDNDLRMLVRSEGNHFREFLIISGGKSNAVVQIKGDLSYKEARKMSKEVQKDKGLEIYSNIN